MYETCSFYLRWKNLHSIRWSSHGITVRPSVGEHIYDISRGIHITIFLLRLDSLASKSVFAIKFARANLEFTTSAAKVLNFGEVTYLS